MNEKLELFAKEASAYAWKMAGDSYHGVSNVSDRQMGEWEMGKFAELIVQDCVNILHNNGYDDAAVELQKHFKE